MADHTHTSKCASASFLACSTYDVGCILKGV